MALSNAASLDGRLSVGYLQTTKKTGENPPKGAEMNQRKRQRKPGTFSEGTRCAVEG